MRAEEVRVQLSDNLQQVVARGEKLEDLSLQADKLNGDSVAYWESARAIRRRLWWRKVKWTGAVLGVAVIVLVIIIVPAALSHPS